MKKISGMNICESKKDIIPCEHYNIALKECILLRDRKLQEIFQNKRCNPSQIIHNTVSYLLNKRYKSITRGKVDPGEHIERLVFEIQNKIIKKAEFKKGFSRPYLLSYIKRTSYIEVLILLQQEGVLPKGKCGNCIHLSLSMPYTCQREKLFPDKQGEPYKPNPWYGKNRSPDDRKCESGFEPVYTDEYTEDDLQDSSPGDYNRTPWDIIFERMENEQTAHSNMIEMMHGTKCLDMRVQNAADGNTRQKYERQYIIYSNLTHLCHEGTSLEKGLETIAGRLGVSLRTVKRDWKDIKEYLAKKNVT
ncbi:MAG: hypothetical protein GY795_08065 [Desulfobacterales bacterium]|nr:hypothetical protein [Desulfobacterales bacterium]